MPTIYRLRVWLSLAFTVSGFLRSACKPEAFRGQGRERFRERSFMSHEISQAQKPAARGRARLEQKGARLKEDCNRRQRDTLVLLVLITGG